VAFADKWLPVPTSAVTLFARTLVGVEKAIRALRRFRVQ
jgi:hypothetical protein